MTGASTADDGPARGARFARLSDRGVIRVTGPDAVSLLQGVLTQDMTLLETQTAVYAGLLSPQGKILCDFFVAKAEADLLIEAPRERMGDLVKRLTMYRLRAKAAFADVSGEFTVGVAWGEAPVAAAPPGGVVFADPRVAALGWRALVPADAIAAWAHHGGAATPSDAWHAHRIALGVPEGGRDFVYGDAFPHEADMDQLGGVSFAKGCYVGQEVVSRMQHRGTARKRIVQAIGDGDLTMGAIVSAGEAAIGAIGSVAGHRAVALVRLDRAADARAKGVPLTAGGVPVSLAKPGWARFEMEPSAREEVP